MGLRPPKTVAEAGKDRMMSGGGNAPLPTKPDQAGAGGVKCGQCGHYHRAGNICSYNKSFTDDLSSFMKSNDNRVPKGTKEGGQFAPKNQGVKDSKPMKHSGPHGSGDGDGKKTEADTGVVSTSQGQMSSNEFADSQATNAGDTTKRNK